MPDIEGDLDVDIDEKDLRIDTYRSSGAGGQHINKDDTVKKGPVKRENAKVYPNDPCPCGSGLKYKNCCGRK